MAWWASRSLVPAAAVLLAGIAAARAQISPGPLSAPHADLEGISHCGRCHAGSASSDEKCLECHRAIGERVRTAQGLHGRMKAAGPKGRRCGGCHAEHNGRDYQLIYWGEAGRDRFDHGRTGYRLEGKHARAECGACHRPEWVRAKLKSVEPGIDTGRTFLGLGTGCPDCHEDIHRAQFVPRGCPECHGQERWIPAADFSHARTRYPLRGRHEGVKCGRCHPGARSGMVPGPGAAEPRAGGAAGEGPAVRFAGLKFGDCIACHKNPHRTRLGARCDGCHSETGWAVKQNGGRGFDHGRTRFELRGRHRTTACEACHGKETRTAEIRFGRCVDCHPDIHEDGFRSARLRGKCELCHTEEGFLPATYGPEEHDKGPWALEGAHWAIACNRCHPRTPGSKRIGFRTSGTDCVSCHEDRHRGQFTGARDDRGCRACHATTGWRPTSFDHAKSAYPLDGRHADVPCAGCHPRERDPAGKPFVRYSPLRHACRDCHGKNELPVPAGGDGVSGDEGGGEP